MSTDARNTGSAPMQVFMNGVQHCHAGHENVGAVDKDTHQRDRDRYSESAASCHHGMQQTEKRQRKEHAGP